MFEAQVNSRSSKHNFALTVFSMNQMAHFVIFFLLFVMVTFASANPLDSGDKAEDIEIDIELRKVSGKPGDEDEEDIGTEAGIGDVLGMTALVFGLIVLGICCLCLCIILLCIICICKCLL